MTNFTEQLENIARRVRLSSRRKQEIKAGLSRFIEVSEIVRAHDMGRHVSQSNAFLSFFTKPMSILLMLALLLGVGGSTSLAAEYALPGDILYPVKVDFNEKIATVFSFNAEARAQFEAQLAGRRLEEASILASQEKLNDATQADLSLRFERQAKGVKLKIHNLDISGNANAAANVASEFETSLKSHRAVFNKLNATTSTRIEMLDIDVLDELDDTTKLRVNLEGRLAAQGTTPTVRAAAEGRLGAATNIIAATRKRVENQSSRLNADVIAQVEVKLKAADQLILDGEAKIKIESYGEAFNLANAAIRKAQEAMMLVRVKSNLNLEIKINGDDNDEDANESASSSVNNETRINASSSNRDNSSNSERSENELEIRGDSKTNLNLPGGSELDEAGRLKVNTGL